MFEDVDRRYDGDALLECPRSGFHYKVCCRPQQRHRLGLLGRMATAKEYGDQADDQSASTFALTEEDHTLANSLRYILNKDPRVSFVGYSIPHPSEERVHLRVQTTGPTARSVFKDSLQDLMAVCEHVRVTFEQAVEDEKVVRVVGEISVSGKSGVTHQTTTSAAIVSE